MLGKLLVIVLGLVGGITASKYTRSVRSIKYVSQLSQENKTGVPLIIFGGMENKCDWPGYIELM